MIEKGSVVITELTVRPDLTEQDILAIVAFIARINKHSLEAHIAGLGMTDVGTFAVEFLFVIYAFFAANPGSHFEQSEKSFYPWHGIHRTTTLMVTT